MTASPAARVAGFTLATVLPAAATLVSLPVLAHALDRPTWAGLAVGQSVGGMVSLVAAGGWALTGPAALATASDATRRSLYEASLRLRVVVAVLAIPVGMLVTYLLVAESARTLSLAVSASASLVALSPRWFLVGTGTARDVLRFEALPVAGAHLTAAAAIAVGASPLVFPAATATAYVGSALALAIAVRSAPRDPSVRVPWRSRWAPTATEVVGGAYSTVNVALVSVPVSVGALAGYASGWKLYQWGVLVVAGACQALQGWVATAPAERVQRFRTALAMHAAIGVAGLVGFVLLGGRLTSLLFGESLEVPDGVAVWFGAAVLFLSLNSSLGRHVLVTSGRVDAVLTSTLVGAAFGVPAILVLAARHGAMGGAVGLALTEALVFAYQLAVAWPLLRGPRPTDE